MNSVFGLRQLARRSAQLARPATQKVPKRFSSAEASPEELDSQIDKWTKISAGSVGLVVLGVIYGFATVQHSPPPKAIYPYMHMRHKRFPWGDGDTPIFGDTPIDIVARGGEVEHHH